MQNAQNNATSEEYRSVPISILVESAKRLRLSHQGRITSQ